MDEQGLSQMNILLLPLNPFSTLLMLVTDKLLKKLNDRGFRSIGYTGDLVILIQESFLETLFEFTRG